MPRLPEALILSAQHGNATAIASLLVAAQPDIRRYARATCRSADVDDAVQDALCLLHRRIGSLRMVSAFAGWMFTLVRRECTRLARRGLAHMASIETIADDQRFAMRPETDLRLDLAAAIHSLPDHYRRIILMRDVNEFTIAEIADILEATRETVKARLHRARRLLREYLEQ